MKILKFFLVMHIILSLILLLFIFYGSEIFTALGVDVPWDEMMSAASSKIKEMTIQACGFMRVSAIRAADWLADVYGNASEKLSCCVAQQRG